MTRVCLSVCMCVLERRLIMWKFLKIQTSMSAPENKHLITTYSCFSVCHSLSICIKSCSFPGLESQRRQVLCNWLNSHWLLCHFFVSPPHSVYRLTPCWFLFSLLKSPLNYCIFQYNMPLPVFTPLFSCFCIHILFTHAQMLVFVISVGTSC